MADKIQKTQSPTKTPMPRGADPAGQAAQQQQQPDRTEIAKRAFERFEKRGGEHGRDQEDWLEAEKEVSKNKPR